jgi:DNA-binding NarL/FixJ family response regulator
MRVLSADCRTILAVGLHPADVWHVDRDSLAAGRVLNVMKYGTVVLADTHFPMLEGVRSLLEQWFESVVMVADENSLLLTAQKLQPDLAIVDLSFPLSKGRNIVAFLHDRFPDMKLIALSMHDEPVAIERVLSAGASAFVRKRSAITELIPGLQEVTHGRVYISPDTKSKLQSPGVGINQGTKHVAERGASPEEGGR